MWDERSYSTDSYDSRSWLFGLVDAVKLSFDRQIHALIQRPAVIAIRQLLDVFLVRDDSVSHVQTVGKELTTPCTQASMSVMLTDVSLVSTEREQDGQGGDEKVLIYVNVESEVLVSNTARDDLVANVEPTIFIVTTRKRP